MFDVIQGCPQLNTKAWLPFGLQQDGTEQIVCDAHILPVDYLCPFQDATGVLNKTAHTISIHWFSKSLHGKRAAWKMKITRPFHRFFELFK